MGRGMSALPLRRAHWLGCHLTDGSIAAAILFRPRSPFTHDLPPHLDGTPVLIIDNEKDSRRSPGAGLRLAERLVRAGARVTHHVLPVGHSITAEDKRIASEWLRAVKAPVPSA